MIIYNDTIINKQIKIN